MAESAQGVSGKLSAGSQAVKDYGGKSHDSAMSVDELTKAIENHNQKQASTVSEAQTSIAMLGQYKTVIDECAGAGSVSASKQAQLEWALKGVNDACGTAYTSEQVLSGEYRNQQGEIKNTCAEIDKLIQKRQEEVRVKATQSGYSEAVENEIKMKHNLTDAQGEFNDKVKEYVKAGNSQVEAEQLAYAWEAQNGNKLKEATKAYKSAKKETESWATELAVASATCSDAGKAAQDFINKTDGFSTAAKKAGVPVISCMGCGNRTDPTKLEVCDLFETKNDPLARVMRRELRKRGITDLKVVCSTEPPVRPFREVQAEENRESQETASREADGKGRKKLPPGSVAFVPSVAGLIAASVAVRELLQ